MKLRIIPVMLLLLLLLTGCRDSTDPADAERWKEQAKINAALYVQYKYGFDADIKDAVPEKQGLWIGWKSLDHIFVTMQHDDRSFVVYIDGAMPCMDGYDNYQADEIQSAIETEIREILPDAVSVTPHFRMPYEEAPYTVNLFSEKYDGTNLREITAAKMIEFSAVCLHADLSDASIDGKIRTAFGEETNASLISVRKAGQVLEDRLLTEPLYCESVRHIRQDSSAYAKYAINSDEASGFIWCWKDTGQPAPDVRITQTKNVHPDAFPKVLSPVTSVYQISAPPDANLWFYYPKENVQSGADFEHLYCAFEYADRHDWDSIRKTGDYLRFSPPSKSDGRFTFFIGQTEKQTTVK